MVATSLSRRPAETRALASFRRKRRRARVFSLSGDGSRACDLPIRGTEAHRRVAAARPDLVAAEAGFYPATKVAAAKEMGVKLVSARIATARAVRDGNIKSDAGSRGQKWRTGREGRISLLKGRHGLRKSIDKKEAGTVRWLGFRRVADISGQSDARFTSNPCSVNDLGARAQIGPDMSF